MQKGSIPSEKLRKAISGIGNKLGKDLELQMSQEVGHMVLWAVA